MCFAFSAFFLQQLDAVYGLRQHLCFDGSVVLHQACNPLEALMLGVNCTDYR
jgi:hypothetical protein